MNPGSLWIRRFAPAPDAPARLVCLPHAGGAAVFYGKLAKALSPQVDTLAVQYPGRQDRHAEPFVASVAALADALTAELVPWADRTVALFGHSLGALVAFEVAGRLEALGRPPAWLFASGRGAPCRPRRESAHQLDDRALVQHVRDLGGTDPRLLHDEELVQLLLPVIRADYEVLASYRYTPRPPLGCPVTVINGHDDPGVTPDDAEAWRRHTTGAFDSVTLPGGHFYLVERHAEVTGALTRRLAHLPQVPRR